MAANGNAVDSPEHAFDTTSTVPFWLDGKQVISGSVFPVKSPIDQKVLYQCSSADDADVSKAIESAQRAFLDWSQTKPRTRRDIFLRVAEEFKKRRDEFRHYSLTETGASEAIFAIEHGNAYQACIDIAGLIQVATTSDSPILEAEGSTGLVLKEPFGVVLGIAPWNGPNALGLRACLQPLAMGNTVILKGPESAPATYWAIASAFHAAGLPAGCLNTLYHCPQDAAKITKLLISHPNIRKLNFTGSTAVGSVIASLAGQYLKPTVMELGGKAPAIVCEDANIELAAFQCCLGAFLHAGQICMSTERIIVNSAIASQFREALKGALGRLFGQDNIPQLINSAAVDKNRALISDALSNGAHLLHGDPGMDTKLGPTRMTPAVVEDVTTEMKIYLTESFGPTVGLYFVESDEDAIKLANDTEFGLTSAVFTEDLRRALKIAKKIDSGAVHINAMTIHDENALPHGGVKNSGFGRFDSLAGLQEWTRTKQITWRD
ncbi:aldehyde dehydrogenase [Stagonosporopsis vannaccii]|nr:aldehyde dehydrogenase [Stagonosporopsis vannaccii]